MFPRATKHTERKKNYTLGGRVIKTVNGCDWEGEKRGSNVLMGEKSLDESRSIVVLILSI